MSELSRSSLLSFPLVLKDGTYLETAGDAVDYFFGLTQRDQGHWIVAIRMLNNALHEPTYLKSETISLQTAFLLDGILIAPHPLDRS